MSPREIARHIGSPRSNVPYYAQAITIERSGRNDRALPKGRERCQAGSTSRLFLRCTRPAVIGERWCGKHHPSPPTPPASPVRTRVPADELWRRGDGQVLEALYDLADWMEHNTLLMQEMLERVQRREVVEAASADATDEPTWMTVDEVAQYARLSSRFIRTAIASGDLRTARAWQAPAVQARRRRPLAADQSPLRALAGAGHATTRADELPREAVTRETMTRWTSAPSEPLSTPTAARAPSACPAQTSSNSARRCETHARRSTT